MPEQDARKPTLTGLKALHCHARQDGLTPRLYLTLARLDARDGLSLEQIAASKPYPTCHTRQADLDALTHAGLVLASAAGTEWRYYLTHDGARCAKQALRALHSCLAKPESNLAPNLHYSRGRRALAGNLLSNLEVES